MNKIFSLLKQLNMQSVKKYWIDILLVAVFFLGGAFFAQKPGTDARVQQVKENIGKPVPELVVKKEAPAPAKTGAAPLPTAYKKLDERNIFVSSGGYEVTKNLMRIPENPYTLIAILHGSEKRIVIREFTGDLVSVKEGGTLIDGAIVKKIGDSIVTLEMGNQTRELKILDYKELAMRKPVVTPPPAGAKPGSQGTVRSGNVPSQGRAPAPRGVPQPGTQSGGGGTAATTQRGR
jgi:hypothetical protein